MTNHMHLLVTPERAESLPRTMQLLGRRYARAINAANAGTGTLWEGRCRAAPIDSEAYFLACCRYIGINRSKSDGLIKNRAVVGIAVMVWTDCKTTSRIVCRQVDEVRLRCAKPAKKYCHLPRHSNSSR